MMFMLEFWPSISWCYTLNSMRLYSQCLCHFWYRVGISILYMQFIPQYIPSLAVWFCREVSCNFFNWLIYCFLVCNIHYPHKHKELLSLSVALCFKNESVFDFSKPISLSILIKNFHHWSGVWTKQYKSFLSSTQSEDSFPTNSFNPSEIYVDFIKVSLRNCRFKIFQPWNRFI